MADLVPADRMDWTPGGGVWTFADLIRHLAVIERWMFVENALGRPSRYTTHGAELAAMAEHEAHHRGQIYVMLRLCGIDTPPLFGLTSEEVRKRSGG